MKRTKLKLDIKELKRNKTCIKWKMRGFDCGWKSTISLVISMGQLKSETTQNIKF